MSSSVLPNASRSVSYRDAGLLDGPVDVHAMQALVIEQLVGGVEKTLTNRCAIDDGLVHIRGPICQLGRRHRRGDTARGITSVRVEGIPSSTVGGDDQ